MAKFPIAEWQAEHARLTVFPTPQSAAFDIQQWWQEMAGAPPDEVTTNPKRGTALAAGAFGPGKLVLRLEPHRLDWVLEPQDRPPDADVEFITIGPVLEAFQTFSSIAERWLSRPDAPDIVRMAFGAGLIHPIADRPTAYRQLTEYIPVDLDPESSDLFFQINLPPVPSAAGVPQLQLNRLSKWHVLALRAVGLRLSVGGGGGPVQRNLTDELLALRVELDVNTVATFAGPIPRDRLTDVYREVEQCAMTMVAEGIRRR